MIAKTVTHEFILCPHCGEGESRIDHIKIGTSAGPWYCDECGKSYSPGRTANGMEAELHEDRKITTLDLLQFPSPTPLFFVIRGMRFEGPRMGPLTAVEEVNGKRYHYEEHSCPTNWIPDIELLSFDGNVDPHGALEFVRSVDAPANIDKHNGTTHPDWLPLFPELKADA